VVKELNDCCLCLSIQTYRRQGVAKYGVIKNHHSIIYTGSSPQMKTDEQPRGEEAGMRRPVLVEAKSKTEKMDKTSRVNYAKIYTVEHNVKVYDFGQVERGYLNRLITQFQAVFDGSSQAAEFPHGNTTNDQGDNGGGSGRGQGSAGNTNDVELSQHFDNMRLQHQYDGT